MKTENQMPSYELYEHAGRVPFADWKARGIEIPVFDKDGTLTHANQLRFVDEVIEGFKQQGLSNIYPNIAVPSNNHSVDHVRAFAEQLESEVGVSVFAVCRGHGYSGKPDTEMGLVIAQHFGVRLDQLGVIGDRRLTDIRFGRKLGVGAIALCKKAGEGDTKWVPSLRRVETIIVGAERLMKVAVQGWDTNYSSDTVV